ncbi:MAG: phosphatidylglycerophosphatase A [Chitinivibrionales bacterium]|nr:phosphatidylglycerophosphatase A [Chitinivibrionales bacterium]
MKTPISQWIWKFFSSLFFFGYFPIAPGTVGSAVTVAVVWIIKIKAPHLLAFSLVKYHWAVLFAVSGLVIYLCQRGKEAFNADDPKQVVVDEFAGQLITFFMVPITWRTCLLGFLLFRFFDIIKPYPVFKLEEIEGGVGIAMDDIVAGVYANFSLIGILWIYHSVLQLLHA